MYYLTYVLHWLAGCLGILAYMIVFSFMPSLLGVASSDHVRAIVLGIPLSVGVLHSFHTAWQIGLLVVGAALFVWISFMFLMSTHNLIVGVVGDATRDREDGERSAQIAMAVCLVILALVFAWIMFGSLFTLGAPIYALLLIGGTFLLLRQNYGEFIDI
ncbi:MAG: hypothetical protein R2834_02255 [Rhodothermales bacterium]